MLPPTRSPQLFGEEGLSEVDSTSAKDAVEAPREEQQEAEEA